MNKRRVHAGWNIFILPLALCIFLMLSAAPLLAKEGNKLASRDVPTDVTAMRMTYDAGKNQVVFEDGVKVVRPDFALDADKLIIYLKSKPKAPESEAGKNDPLAGMNGGDVDRLVALGNVKMRKDSRTGDCGKATYYVDKELLVMEQNPSLHDGENNIRGQVINFYVAENRSEVIGGKGQPVKAIFKSSGKGNDPGALKFGK